MVLLLVVVVLNGFKFAPEDDNGNDNDNDEETPAATAKGTLDAIDACGGGGES